MIILYRLLQIKFSGIETTLNLLLEYLFNFVMNYLSRQKHQNLCYDQRSLEYGNSWHSFLLTATFMGKVKGVWDEIVFFYFWHRSSCSFMWCNSKISKNIQTKADKQISRVILDNFWSIAKITENLSPKSESLTVKSGEIVKTGKSNLKK